MRHAILIHAHHFPDQFGRLCNALRHPDFDVYANIDTKSDFEQFRAAAPHVNYIENRIDVKWGHWSQVEATLNSLSEIMASGKEYGYVLFISGQDYPVMPLSEIAARLDEAGGREFIAGLKPDSKHSQQKRWERRYTKPHYFHPHSKKISSFVNKKILRWMPSQQMPYPIYKGSQWWNLSSDCVRYLLDYCRQNPEIIRSYRSSFCADEMFFQSTLMASPLADRLVSNNFRYIDWSLFYPKVLRAEDYPAIVASDAWFARKVDMRKGAELFDMLDKRLGIESGK